MHTEGSPQADKSKQGGSPTSSAAQKKGKPPDQVYEDRYPDRKVWNRHMHSGQELRRAGWVSQSEKTVPNEEARHQPRERKQVFLADRTGNARSKQLARGGRLFDAGS